METAVNEHNSPPVWMNEQIIVAAQRSAIKLSNTLIVSYVLFHTWKTYTHMWLFIHYLSIHLYCDMFQYKKISLLMLWYWFQLYHPALYWSYTNYLSSCPDYFWLPTPLLSHPLPHSLLLLCSLLPLLYMAAWWSRGVCGEVWELDRWLSHRLMSISTRSDNSDSLTMNVSMSKHQARLRVYMHTYTITWWSRVMRLANSQSGMGKHKLFFTDRLVL